MITQDQAVDILDKSGYTDQVPKIDLLVLLQIIAAVANLIVKFCPDKANSFSDMKKLNWWDREVSLNLYIRMAHRGLSLKRTRDSVGLVKEIMLSYHNKMTEQDFKYMVKVAKED